MNSPRFFCTIAFALCIQTAVQAQVSVTPTQPIQEDVDLTVEDSQTATVEATGFHTVASEGIDLEVVKAAVNPVSGELAIALERKPIVIWDVGSQSITREFADNYLKWESIVYSKDGKFLAGGTYDSIVILYDAATGQAIHTETAGFPAQNLSFNANSSQLIINGQMILDTVNLTLTQLDETFSSCMGVGGTYLPESDRLITIGWREYCVWDAAGTNVLHQSSSPSGEFTAIKASPSEDIAVITQKGASSNALVLDAAGEVTKQLSFGQSLPLGEVHFSVDGKTLALTSGGYEEWGSEVIFVEPTSGKVVGQYSGTNLPLGTEPIYGSTVLRPNTLVLAHGSNGLSFIDFTQEASAAVTAREEELARLAAVPEVEQSTSVPAPTPENDEATEEDEVDVQPSAVSEVNNSQVDNGEPLSFETITDAQLFDIASNGSANRIREIFDLGFGADYRDESGRTFLMYAASSNSLQAIEMILASGAYIDQIDEAGWTALMYAARDNSLDVVETLVENGASVDLTNEDGNTALNLASTSAVERFLSNLLEPVQITEKAEPAEPVQQATPDFTGLSKIRENAIYDFVNLRRNELGVGYEFYADVSSSRLYEDICPSGYATVWYTASSANRPLLFNFYGEVHPEETKYLVFTADVYEPVASPAIVASCIYDQPQKVYRELHRLFVYTSYFDESMLNCEIMVNNDGKKTLWDRQDDPTYATCEGDRNFYR